MQAPESPGYRSVGALPFSGGGAIVWRRMDVPNVPPGTLPVIASGAHVSRRRTSPAQRAARDRFAAEWGGKNGNIAVEAMQGAKL